MKHIPTIGEKLYLYTPCNNFYVAMVRRPYTVDSVNGNTCIVRAARAIFNGPVYYDSLPDRIEDDINGAKMKLRWSEKKNRWQESPQRGYPRVAVFGAWDYQPYLD